ncbi:LLM class flavin-dependent oxidoreductase [Streptomyces sp. AM8-1-1]|uniref:LLM class flavin-dependent oxidoreductase n=1 Tax=Streptomyces sp. AM8-1-1 TaxID=3075825 RepID=UPI0028C50E2A|nr:LLM class flavin-dependent oxidoreductase [Streptomyces sp. AM8-1-1]WNO71813.1 LLM class flavin-dependent oxidoreductase [Streptomyces sp. AM8-1-1]
MAASPRVTAAREYLGIVRGLLDGETVQAEGEYFSCHGGLSPSPAPPVELGLGVLRPGMARVAGAVAGCAITWLTPASYLTVLRPCGRGPRRQTGRCPGSWPWCRWPCAGRTVTRRRSRWPATLHTSRHCTTSTCSTAPVSRWTRATRH